VSVYLDQELMEEEEDYLASSLLQIRILAISSHNVRSYYLNLPVLKLTVYLFVSVLITTPKN